MTRVNGGIVNKIFVPPDSHDLIQSNFFQEFPCFFRRSFEHYNSRFIPKHILGVIPNFSPQKIVYTQDDFREDISRF